MKNKVRIYLDRAAGKAGMQGPYNMYLMYYICMDLKDVIDFQR